MIESLSRKTAVELASLIAAKAVSPVEVLDAHLAVIARVNPKLNAIVTLVADGARALAKQAEAAVMRGDKLGQFVVHQPRQVGRGLAFGKVFDRGQ